MKTRELAGKQNLIPEDDEYTESIKLFCHSFFRHHVFFISR